MKVGRPKKTLIEHLKDGTYCHARHGKIPEELKWMKSISDERWRANHKTFMEKHPGYGLTGNPIGRPPKKLIDHLKDGTYRKDRHGEIPEELRVYKAESKYKVKKEVREAWNKKHPHYSRDRSRAQRDQFLKDHPDWFEQKKEKHKEAILRKKAKQYFRENCISPKGVPAELIALKCDQLKLLRAVRALKKNKGANFEPVEH